MDGEEECACRERERVESVSVREALYELLLGGGQHGVPGGRAVAAVGGHCFGPGLSDHPEHLRGGGPPGRVRGHASGGDVGQGGELVLLGATGTGRDGRVGLPLLVADGADPAGDVQLEEVLEGRPASEELEEEHPEAVDVGRRREEVAGLGGPVQERRGGEVREEQRGDEAVVGEARLEVGAQEHVGRLQVAVDDARLVEVQQPRRRVLRDLHARRPVQRLPLAGRPRSCNHRSIISAIFSLACFVIYYCTTV
jgi:hypothetical protein